MKLIRYWTIVKCIFLAIKNDNFFHGKRFLDYVSLSNKLFFEICVDIKEI